MFDKEKKDRAAAQDYYEHMIEDMQSTETKRLEALQLEIEKYKDAKDTIANELKRFKRRSKKEHDEFEKERKLLRKKTKQLNEDLATKKVELAGLMNHMDDEISRREDEK